MTAASLPAKANGINREWVGFAAILVGGVVLYIATTWFPAEMPFILPWQFEWPVYLATTLSLGWFFIGIRRLPERMRPHPWRRVSFVIGVLSVYAVLQTHYDFLAQHMFFLHRGQHLILHDIGTFLIALGTPGAAIWAAVPDWLKRPLSSRPVRAVVDVIQNPVVAPVLFISTVYVWLIPQLHTRVMLDINLYDFMNWSVAIEGIFFWSLVLDPRPSPPARIGYGWRALIMLAIEPPEMIVGAVITLSRTDFYTVYKICGRIFPIDGITDQNYGGLIIWIPGGLMGLIGLLVVLTNMFMNEEKGAYAQS
ncbi:MAG TPA: cytochrome c oxidase assembly protein [Rhizomicrobium sp.]|jgi:putative membrane protein